MGVASSWDALIVVTVYETHDTAKLKVVAKQKIADSAIKSIRCWEKNVSNNKV